MKTLIERKAFLLSERLLNYSKYQFINVTMNMQHKTTFDDSKPFEYSEGQQGLLCCNGASSGCPSLDLSFEDARQQLLDQGMLEKDFEGLMGFLRNLAQQLIDEELRAINRRRKNMKYEQ